MDVYGKFAQPYRSLGLFLTKTKVFLTRLEDKRTIRCFLLALAEGLQSPSLRLADGVLLVP